MMARATRESCEMGVAIGNQLIRMYRVVAGNRTIGGIDRLSRVYKFTSSINSWINE